MVSRRREKAEAEGGSRVNRRWCCDNPFEERLLLRNETLGAEKEMSPVAGGAAAGLVHADELMHGADAGGSMWPKRERRSKARSFSTPIKKLKQKSRDVLASKSERRDARGPRAEVQDERTAKSAPLRRHPGGGDEAVPALSGESIPQPQPQPRLRKGGAELLMNTISGLKGVYRRGTRWQASIKLNNRGVHLGTVESREKAARLYDQAAFLLGRETNFELSAEDKASLTAIGWDAFLANVQAGFSTARKMGM